jgi:hypothetical protein
LAYDFEPLFPKAVTGALVSLVGSAGSGSYL